jgi:hypothetical protein
MAVGQGTLQMLVGFITLYIELAGLIISGGWIVSSLFIPHAIPNAISSEPMLILSLQ